jgi:hypothetical protein
MFYGFWLESRQESARVWRIGNFPTARGSLLDESSWLGRKFND